MFLYLSKTLPLFVFPPGLTLILLLAAAGIRKRKPLAAGVLSTIALATLYLLSTAFVVDTAMGSLESAYPSVPVEQAAQADAIVVLGGYLHSPSPLHGGAELEEASDRLWMAARLYRAGKAPLVLLTGGNVMILTGKGVSEAAAARDLLHDWGVPSEAILTEGNSQNTRENAEFSAPILRSKGVRRLLLVTSAFHMPRAMAIFRRLGLEAHPIPTDYQTGWGEGETLIRWLPDPENLFRSKVAFREWIGLAVYRLRGWA